MSKEYCLFQPRAYLNLAMVLLNFGLCFQAIEVIQHVLPSILCEKCDFELVGDMYLAYAKCILGCLGREGEDNTYRIEGCLLPLNKALDGSMIIFCCSKILI